MFQDLIHFKKMPFMSGYENKLETENRIYFLREKNF